MRIGILLPGIFALGNPGNGVFEQAKQQARALEALGHKVVELNPWQWQDEKKLDVIHFYSGGPALRGIEHLFDSSQRPALVFSPIIDSNKSFVSYRIAALMGGLVPAVITVPGEFRRQAIASDIVVCRSASEKERVCRGMGISPQKVRIVLNGTSIPDTVDGDASRVQRELDLPDKFVLHVSAFTQERKNVLRLVAAMEKLEYPLVIAGSSVAGPVSASLLRKCGNSKRLRVLGFVDHATKAALYSLCRVFCLPSIHEGTGLSALEAGARGARLVITKKGGTPDYFKNYVEYVDPYSIAGIREAIVRAWSRPDSDELRQYIRRDLTWEASARALEQVYISLHTGRTRT
jgi:glycosyltransferase involved in cell wall biosynthesis